MLRVARVVQGEIHVGWSTPRQFGAVPLSGFRLVVSSGGTEQHHLFAVLLWYDAP